MSPSIAIFDFRRAGPAVHVLCIYALQVCTKVKCAHQLAQ